MKEKIKEEIKRIGENKKKVLLVSLRSPFLDSDRVYPPMGLLYLSSALKQVGHEVDIEDDFGGEERRINDYSIYDFIGVSVTTPQKKDVIKIFNEFKDKEKKPILIIGGPHAKFYTNDVEKEPWDYIIKGEGERAIVKIVNGEAKERIVEEPINQEDFDKLPRPDRLGYKEFIKTYSHTFGGPDKKATVFMSGRGCPMGCTFCEEARTPIRWTDIEKAKKEFDDIQELGFNAIYIIDDLFAISVKKTKPYIEELKRRGIIYRCNGHVKFMTEEFADLLAETGCVEIGIGIESASQKILDTIKKGITVEQAYNCVSMLKKRGIRVRAFFMVGLPGETYETIAESEKFIRESGIDDFQLTVYEPYKGTQIRDEIDKGNQNIDLFIEGEAFAHTQKGGKAKAKIRTKALSSAEILAERDRLIKTYRPANYTKERTSQDYSITKINKTGCSS